MFSNVTSKSVSSGVDCWRAIVQLDFSMGQWACFTLPENMNCPDASPWRPLNTYDEEFTSTSVVVAGNYVVGDYVLAGALTARRSFTHFLIRNRGSVPDFIEIRQEDIPADGSLPPEKIVVLRGNDWMELLIEYARLAAAENGVEPFKAATNLTGYCSWYYYYAGITEKQYMECTEHMVRAREEGGYDARFIQIDDGYQKFQGDWFDQAEAWKTPLGEIAAKVAERGLVPGIWLMPFLASTESRVYREHPDWFVKNKNADTPKLAYGWTSERDNEWACLDTSIPEVIEHLKQIFRQFHDLGFRYFKLDGQANPMIGGRRRDPAATPVSAFHDGMKAIREAVPDDYIMTCTSSYLPCLGLCDGARVSCDTGSDWTRLRWVWQGTVSRFWMFDRWFRCDPDVIIARAPDFKGLPLPEARFSAMNAILTGVAMTSDRLEELDAERMNILSLASRCRLRNVRPISWQLNSWPNAFAGTLDGRNAAALYNWSDVPVTLTRKDMNFAADDSIAVVLGETCGPLAADTLTLQPHDAALVAAK